MFTPTAQERLFEDLTANVAGACITAEATSCPGYCRDSLSGQCAFNGNGFRCLVVEARALKVLQAVRQDFSNRCALPPETQRVVQELKLTSGGVSNPTGLVRVEVGK